MNLAVQNREMLLSLGEAVPNEFDNLIEKITSGWLRQHTEDDGHGNITATGLDVNGPVRTRYRQTFQLTGAANHNLPLDSKATLVLVFPSGAVSITGFNGGTEGRRFVLFNMAASVDALTLLLDDPGSAPPSRIASDLSLSPDTIVIQPGRCVELIYLEETPLHTPRWHVMVKA